MMTLGEVAAEVAFFVYLTALENGYGLVHEEGFLQGIGAIEDGEESFGDAL